MYFILVLTPTTNQAETLNLAGKSKNPAAEAVGRSRSAYTEALPSAQVQQVPTRCTSKANGPKTKGGSQGEVVHNEQISIIKLQTHWLFE